MEEEHNISGATTKPDPKPQASPRRLKKILLIIAAILSTAIVIAALYVGYLFASSPLSIREPLYEHYHFRMQILVDGKAENFAQAKYQEGYSKDNCNANLTIHPVHFHDKKDQFVHIHWEGMTGGQVLKYYGWNFIGGINGSLGYRFDELPRLKSVPIHDNLLPALPDGDKFYVYTGSAGKYQERSFADFTNKDLEDFFGKTSNSPAHELNKKKRSSLFDAAFPKAYAHGTAEEHAAEGDSELSTDELKVLNNLIGDVVIFVQKNKPSDAQVKDRFNHVEPLSESTCAG